MRIVGFLHVVIHPLIVIFPFLLVLGAFGSCTLALALRIFLFEGLDVPLLVCFLLSLEFLLHFTHFRDVLTLQRHLMLLELLHLLLHLLRLLL